jgi:hypothetical protein
LHRASAATRLSTGDHPVDSGEVERAEVFQKRLARQKPDGCRRREQVGDPLVGALLVFG